MKWFLTIVLLSALLPLSAFALCVVQEDQGCGPLTNSCDNPNCSTTTFVADATGTFDLIAKVSCPRPYRCEDCQSFVCLYKTLGSTVLARLSSNNNQCSSCSNITQVSLESGVSYTMVVCLAPCGNHGCDAASFPSCSSECTAVGICKTQNSPCP